MPNRHCEKDNTDYSKGSVPSCERTFGAEDPQRARVVPQCALLQVTDANVCLRESCLQSTQTLGRGSRSNRGKTVDGTQTAMMALAESMAQQQQQPTPAAAAAATAEQIQLSDKALAKYEDWPTRTVWATLSAICVCVLVCLWEVDVVVVVRSARLGSVRRRMGANDLRSLKAAVAGVAATTTAAAAATTIQNIRPTLQ